ncbi:hypothetical protein TYRP_022289 [Tyrophagus putrescentiae]|nr:hypothetical protein TYRP_022289 [Tyrophagus putrescentiae]
MFASKADGVTSTGGVYCLTDVAYVNQCFDGDQEAAINFTIMHFETINQDFRKENLVHIDDETGEEFHFKNFGFDLWAIDLGHEAFSQFEKEQVIDVKKLKITLKSDALLKKLFNYGLVVLFTEKQLSDNHNGFKVGAVCQPPKNAVAVSFYGCQNKNDSTAYDRALRTTKEEFSHSLGVPHSKDEDNDVMKQINSTNMV